MYLLKKLGDRSRQFSAHPVTRKRYLKATFKYVFFHFAASIKTELTYSWIHNLKLLVRKGDAGIVANVFLGLYEYSESAFLIHFIREEDLFLDIGANLGHYALLASGIKKCESIAVEPVPATFAQLKRQINLNQLSNKIAALNIGVGNIDTSLFFSTDMGTMNRIVEKGYRNAVEIPVKTLDSICAGKAPSLLKIDVEGFEKFVLEGSKTTLKDPHLKAIIIEINFSSNIYDVASDDIVSILKQHNFNPYKYEPMSRIITPLIDYNKEQFNTIFIRDITFVKERIEKSEAFQLWNEKI